MIIECGSCGFLRSVKHEGTPEEIEQDINNTIQEGWRFVKSWDGYICPKCAKNGTDALYELYVGKPKKCGKTDSYKHLLIDTARLIQMLRS